VEGATLDRALADPQKRGLRDEQETAIRLHHGNLERTGTETELRRQSEHVDTDQRAVLVTSSSHAIKKSRSCRKNAVLTSVSEVYDRRKAQRLSLMLVP
jgi:hypothetical protein